MSMIDNLLKKILSAVYGEDVRDSIHDAIKLCYEEMQTASDIMTDSRTEIEAARKEISLARSEIADARHEIHAARTEIAAGRNDIILAQKEVIKVRELLEDLDLDRLEEISQEVTDAANFAKLSTSVIELCINAHNYLPVRFWSGDNLVYLEWVVSGETIEDPVATGKIDAPTKPPYEDIRYVFSGWDTDLSGLTVTEAVDIYAQYAENLQLYTVNFYNDTELLQTSQVRYGDNAEFSGDEPTKDSPSGTITYVFSGWDPEPTYIIEDTDCYAKFVPSASINLVERDIDGTYTNDRVTYVGYNAFRDCVNLDGVVLENVVTIDTYAFAGCTSLASVDLPKVSIIYQHAFDGCSSLLDLNVPLITDVHDYAFAGCTKLTIVDLHNTLSIGQFAFSGCTGLTAVILRSASVVPYPSLEMFYNTPIASGSGYIYVPSALVSAYQADSTWSAYSFRAIEDHPSICG